MSRTAIVLGVESLSPGKGGICRVARLMGKVLREEAQAGRVSAEAIVLNDGSPEQLAGLPGATALGSRLSFVARIQKAQVSHTHFIYDFLGVARAHSVIPILQRPFMAFIHGVEVWEGAPASRIKAARRAHGLLANSSYTRERASRSCEVFKRSQVCWLGTEEDELPPSPRRAAGAPAVLVVGRMESERYKGHKELIECWPRVVAAVPDARLIIVGTGTAQQEYQKLAAAVGCAGQIDFPGFVAEDEMASIWANSRVFAMPSRGEGFGLVYIEAMRHGLPVIASIHDAAPEINIDGETGFNVNLDVPADLPEKLIYLLKSPDHAAALGRNGQARWQKHFCFSAFRDRFKPILWDFLNHK